MYRIVKIRGYNYTGSLVRTSKPIHGNELYRLNINDFSYELWMDINREKNTNVLQLMKNNENGYFISDNTIYQYNGENFAPISEKNTTLLPSRFYHYEITNYKQLEDVNNKLIFRNIDNYLISIDKNTGTVDNIGYVINNVDDFLEPELFLKYENKIYFFSFDNNQYNINVTDGTTNNTRTLANSNNNYILLNPNYIKYHENHNKIYFISNVHTSSYLNFINPTDDAITTITELNLSRAIIHHTFGNYLLISGYNQLTRQFELYLSDGQSLGTKIPVTLGSHQITGSFIKDNTIYFTFNNKFYSYNITTGNSNQIFATNYERLFYLKQCGNSFYYKDEFNKQIFRTTGNSTTLIKKFTDDYQNTIGVCNNNVMYYLNDDYVNRTAYTPKKNYIVASTDQQHYEIEIEHEFNNYGRSSSTDIKDLMIIENKILFNYYNSMFGQELLVGNLSNLTLNTTDFPPNIHEDKSNIKIYPNPTANYLNIETKDNIDEINLYNNNGQLIKIHLNPTKSINLSKYPKGIYYIRIKTNTTTETKKVIKN